MASEWIKLKVADPPQGESRAGRDAPKGTTVYVNLSNASSIYPEAKGASIWFLADAVGGKIFVQETPDKILKRSRGL